MTTTTTTYCGTCACRTITWTSTSAPTSLDFCHCTQCQRISGAPFVAWLAFPSSTLNFHDPGDGGAAITTTRLLISDGMDSIATRSFCNSCGSTLNMQYDCYKGERVHVAAGSLVEGTIPETLPRARIWVEDCPGWYQVPKEDGVRVWEGFDEEFKAVLRRFEQGEREKGYEPVGELPGGYEDLEEGSEDEVLIRMAVERATEVMGESDEELMELRRRYGGGGGGVGRSARKEVEVEEYMYDSD